MHKKRNGFTLIELLVTLALIISILTLAVTSVIKISDKQKENAFEKVKEQVETAAEQYFESNEYLYENLPEDGFGIITLGKLVEGDYLNKLTNPITGMPLNDCDKVKVKRNTNGKFEMMYIGVGDEICFSTNTVSIQSNPNAPNLELKFVRNDFTEIVSSAHADNWINKSELGNEPLKVFVEIKTNADKDNVRYCNSYAEKCTEQNIKEFNAGELLGEKDVFYDTISYSNDTSQKQVCYVATNSDGYHAKCINVGVDTKKPNVNLALYNDNKFQNPHTSWINTAVYYKYDASDDTSGLSNESQLVMNKEKLTIDDVSKASYAWDTSELKYKGSDSKQKITGEDAVKNGSGYLPATTETDGVRKVRYVVCDVAGNCNSEAEATAYIDKTPPVFHKFEFLDIPTNANWYNKDIKYQLIVYDTISGMSSIKGYFNAPGLTETKATSDDAYAWDGTRFKGEGSKNMFMGGFSSEPNTKIEYAYTVKDQGYRRIKYYICDQAGNCPGREKVIKIDKEAPKFLRSGSGPVLCKRANESGNNSHGYSVEAQDNLSGTTIKLVEYFSSWDCGITKDFGWATSSSEKSVAEDGKKIFTALAGCSNNPAPGARFALVDGAGNEYVGENGKKYLEIKHSAGSYSTANIKDCSSIAWFDESPNR